jgi:hypothetical protein
MNEVYVVDQKENPQGYSVIKSRRERKTHRVFGKELQNFKPEEVTPKRRATRVDGALTPQPVHKAVSVVESFALEVQHVPEYQESILSYLRDNEPSYRVGKDYLATQPEITAKMRAILIDWLVDVSLKFKLLPQCLFMTVNLLDRFLSRTELPRQKLQLAGITSLMIVSKFEEIFPPMLKDYVCVCDNAYTKTELLEMEGRILGVLNFNVAQTSSFGFLKMFNSKLKMENSIFVFARYLLECALLDSSSLKHDNISLAAGAIFLVNKIFKKDSWTDSHRQITQATEEQVKAAAKDLYVILHRQEASELTAVKRKFAHESYFEVSKYKIERAQNRN